MYTQFYGNFLLNNNYITPAQLAEALEIKNTTRVKLGILAMNEGFLTSEQIEEIHNSQARMDKKFGDIAVELGYITESQLATLLSSQKTGLLLLGQALVNLGFLSNADFERTLKEYKEKYQLDDNDVDEFSDSITKIVSEFYHFDKHNNTKIFTAYATLLFKNLVRFIGDDFTPLEASLISNLKCKNISSQNIVGPFSSFTAIEGNSAAFAEFASRFANEEITEVDELAFASVGEFLNLHNGLFTVNMSNEKNIELELKPQVSNKNTVLSLVGSAFCIPINFTFGTINFVISNLE